MNLKKYTPSDDILLQRSTSPLSDLTTRRKVLTPLP